MTIKTLIVDDSSQARELLRLMLTEVAPDISVVGEAENVEEAVSLIRSEKPTLIFLDIEMPGKNGLQLLDELDNESIDFQIIFVTAYNQYAIQAFRLSALDYLLKPVKRQELLDALEKFRTQTDWKTSAERLKALNENLKIQQSNTLSLPLNFGNEYINTQDIEYIEADTAYSYVYLVSGDKKTISKNLKYFENALCELDSFVKAHRSYIINLVHVKEFHKDNRGTLILKSGKKINLSRSQRTLVLSKMKL